MPALVRRLRGSGGFTLIEVIVAAGLLCVGLVATLGALNAGQHASLGSTRAQSAYESAQAVLEQVVALGKSNWAAVAVSGDTTGAAPSSVGLHVTPPGVPGAETLVGAASTCTTWTNCVPASLSVAGGTAYLYVTKAADQTLTVTTTTAQTIQPLRIMVAVVMSADAAGHTVAQPTWVSTVVAPRVTV